MPNIFENFQSPSEHKPLFSIIIPVRNEEHNIAKCLSALSNLQTVPHLFEIIVVDNGSTDRTREVAAGFVSTLGLQVLEWPNAYIAAVRNAGAAVAQGKYLAFLDSDCEVLPDWLAQAWLAISRGITGVFGSYYLIPKGSSWIARYWNEVHDKSKAGEVPYLPGGDLFVSRELFQTVRGFDETIQTNEDYEFCQRIRSTGHPITCIPELAVIHWGTPQSLVAFYRKNRWHGMHVFRVFLRNPPALHNVKPIALALYTLCCILGLLISIGIVLQGGSLRYFDAFFLALLVPPLALGIRSAASARRLEAVVPLATLYLAYGLARASAIVDWRHWSGYPGKNTRA
jgi:glycosyltransferase involved in cell wall biosynthesis